MTISFGHILAFFVFCLVLPLIMRKITQTLENEPYDLLTVIQITFGIGVFIGLVTGILVASPPQ